MIPSQSERGFQILQPDRPACGSDAARRRRGRSSTTWSTAGRSRTRPGRGRGRGRRAVRRVALPRAGRRRRRHAEPGPTTYRPTAPAARAPPAPSPSRCRRPAAPGPSWSSTASAARPSLHPGRRPGLDPGPDDHRRPAVDAPRAGRQADPLRRPRVRRVRRRDGVRGQPPPRRRARPDRPADEHRRGRERDRLRRGLLRGTWIAAVIDSLRRVTEVVASNECAPPPRPPRDGRSPLARPLPVVAGHGAVAHPGDGDGLRHRLDVLPGPDARGHRPRHRPRRRRRDIGPPEYAPIMLASAWCRRSAASCGTASR